MTVVDRGVPFFARFKEFIVDVLCCLTDDAVEGPYSSMAEIREMEYDRAERNKAIRISDAQRCHTNNLLVAEAMCNLKNEEGLVVLEAGDFAQAVGVEVDDDMLSGTKPLPRNAWVLDVSGVAQPAANFTVHTEVIVGIGARSTVAGLQKGAKYNKEAAANIGKPVVAIKNSKSVFSTSLQKKPNSAQSVGSSSGQSGDHSSSASEAPTCLASVNPAVIAAKVGTLPQALLARHYYGPGDTELYAELVRLSARRLGLRVEAAPLCTAVHSGGTAVALGNPTVNAGGVSLEDTGVEEKEDPDNESESPDKKHPGTELCLYAKKQTSPCTFGRNSPTPLKDQGALVARPLVQLHDSLYHINRVKGRMYLEYVCWVNEGAKSPNAYLSAGYSTARFLRGVQDDNRKALAEWKDVGELREREKKLAAKAAVSNLGLTVEHQLLIREMAAYLKRKKGRVRPTTSATTTRAQRTLQYQAAGRLFENVAEDVDWTVNPLTIRDAELQEMICTRVSALCVIPSEMEIHGVRVEQNSANTRARWEYQNPNATSYDRMMYSDDVARGGLAVF